ncbi:MAG: HlyD family efflux transporter periplasmic adaptor subunit [Myxacorys californica WJT36-NPBG1]|jgi:HlyD family secretion protein|nr:HlyD family efflux transporter periplasmic adaptor subunit [Myxacorys californica WJT36-NPBG1]
MTATNEPPPNHTPLSATGTSASAPKRPSKPPSFEHPLMMQQTSMWSQAILWGLMVTATTAVLWANFSKIEEAIPVQGKLEPQGTVKEVQIPVNGVVKAVHVQDGQRIKRGDLLLSLDQTSPQAQLASLAQVRMALLQENQFYQAQMQGKTVAFSELQIPPQFLSLTKSRAALVAENQLFRTQLDGSTQGLLTSAQQERLQSNQAELNSRAIAARLDTEQLRRQLSQIQIKLVGLKQTLALNQKILTDMKPVAESGAISRVQYLKQQQEVTTNQSEVDQLIEEQARIEAAITQSQVKVQNTLEVDRKDNTAQIAHNDQRIAEIDSQLTKAIVENNKKISEIDSQITQSQQTLKYSQLNAPVSGTVFDLKAHTSGFVASPAEPILKIVPDDSLIAKVSITNHDIGFVKEGMAVDVRIDSFPFSEFGDIKGTIVWIGSDALPPTQIQPVYTFPAKIRLEKQSLMADGREVRLQSGMSLNANVKLRSRTIMSIFTDQFTKTAESMKFVR